MTSGLGELVDISYNNVSNLKQNIKLLGAQIEDSKVKKTSSYIQVLLYSLILSILILIILVLIRNMNN